VTHHLDDVFLLPDNKIDFAQSSEVFLILLGSRTRCANKPPRRYKYGTNRQLTVKGSMRDPIGTHLVYLTACISPSLYADVTGLSLKAELTEKAVVGALGDEVLTELKSAVKEVDVGVPVSTQESHERLIKLPLFETLKIAADNVFDH
jgi:hypothetical protein